MAKTLYDKLWDSHVVRQDEDGTCLLYIDRHLVHEVTSPQAFEGLRMALDPLVTFGVKQVPERSDVLSGQGLAWEYLKNLQIN